MILVSLLFFLPAQAQSNEPVEVELPTVQIFGSGPENLQRPLAPKKISKEKVETYQYTDVNRALKQTSGVYTREEDGQGLRPNIGLRGTNPDRSKKVTLMQDEILIGPAPYSAPAAYYTPTMNHTSSLEIYKGFSAVPYGPNSIGGAVNYLTPDIPVETQHRLGFSAGSFKNSNIKLGSGGPLSKGGYLIEGSQLHSDGFKKLENGDKTGYDQNHFLLKLAYDLNSQSRVILSLGYGDEVSKETYLGLTPFDFEQDPYQRYAASQLDQMRWTHTRVNLKHIQQLTGSSSLETALYRHDFHRDWYRLDRFGNSNVSMRDVVNNPDSYQAYYEILRGRADSSTLAGQNGELVIANNDRTFFSQGLQTKYSHTDNFEDGKNQFELLVRLHSDEIRRNHTSDQYQMVSGNLERTAAPTTRVDLNRDQAQAMTAALVNNYDIYDWTLTPVLRYETINFKFKNELTQAESKRNDSFWVPGFGVTRKFSDALSVRVSANRAATVAGLSSDGSERREEANNYETEFKYQNQESRVEAEVTIFVNDYRNITGTCSFSAGCSGANLDQQFNGGSAMVRGIEGRVATEFNLARFLIPIQFNLTQLRTEFTNEFNSTSPEWGIGTIRIGDPLPYVPQTQYSLSVGLNKGALKQELTLTYFGTMFDQSAENNRLEIPSHSILDWAGSYALKKSLQITAKADNLLAKNHSVSLRPYGMRPGKPQSFQVGLVYTF